MEHQYFKNWRHGALVSFRLTGGHVLEGRAIVWERRSDGHMFYRVKLTSGSCGEQWASSGWAIGSGAHDLTCGQCIAPFRSDDSTDRLCPTCLTEAARPDGAIDDTFTALGRPGPRRRHA